MTTSRRFDPFVEIFLSGGWRDVTADVRYQDGRTIQISHGQTDLTSQVSSQLSLVLNNRSKQYSPRNAVGPWYGSIRQNAPIRTGSRAARDLYVSRSASNGWGAASWALGALTWSVTGGVAGDYAVTGGVGTHRLTSTAARLSSLPVTIADCEQRVTVQLPFSVPTGGPVYTSLCFRGIGGQFYRTRMTVNTSGSVQVQMIDYDGTTLIGSPVTVTGLTYAGQKLVFAAFIHDGAFRAKVWDASLPEPYAWTVSLDGFAGAGFWLSGTVGVETTKHATNSNGTFSVSYSDYQLLFRDFYGEISALEPDRDASGKDIRMELTAAGPLRRLRANSNTKPLQSPAYRALSRAAGLVAYWPCEDGSNASQIAAVRPDWAPATFLSGKPQLGAFNRFLASEPLPVIGTAVVDGQITPYTAPAANAISTRWMQYVDTTTSSGEPVDGASLMRWYSLGTAAYWILRYKAGGGLAIQIEDTTETTIYTAALPGAAVNDKQLRFSMEATQNGANIDWTVTYGVIGVPASTMTFGTTLASQTLGTARSVTWGTDQNLENVTIGHVTVQNVTTSFFDFINELNAWQGEQSIARVSRICAEQGIAFHGEGDTSVLMGPQPIAAPMDFLDQTVEVDLGLATEWTYEDAIGYMTSQILGSQKPVHMTLDYANRQLFDKLPSADDDLLTVNAVTADSTNSGNGSGSSVTMTQATGAKAAVSIEQGGVGVYDKKYSVNSATYNITVDLAGYLLMCGTLDLPRILNATMWLHNPRIYGNLAMLLTAMQTDEGKILSLTNLPTDVSSDPLRQTVIGFQKRLTPYEYAATWYTTPNERYQVAIVDDLNARLDAGASYLNANITSGATTMTVKSNDGTLWTTGASDFPFDIRLGGEQMTVTNITGSSSPQTFTVTRAVNGVSKAHTADDTEQARVTVVAYATVALA